MENNFKDQNKYLLVAYERGNINNRRFVNFSSGEDKKITKSKLMNIDNYTSNYTKQELYKNLLELGIITEEKTEFVIWSKQTIDKKVYIQQTPVIYNDKVINTYTHALHYSDICIDYINKEAENLNKKFIYNIDQDSKKYDSLSEQNKEQFKNTNSFSKKFMDLEYVNQDIRNAVSHRVYGIPYIEKNKLIKSGRKYSNIYGNVLNKIKENYRNFRNVYQYIYGTLVGNEYKNLSYDSVFNNITFDLSDLYKFLLEEEFIDEIYQSDLPEKVKNYSNRIYQTPRDIFDFDTELVTLQEYISNYYTKHKNKMNILMKEYTNKKIR